jgi:precorrin-4 methylase
MNSLAITAFEARVIRLAAEGKIPAEVVAGISNLIAEVNQLRTELNRLRAPERK